MPAERILLLLGLLGGCEATAPLGTAPWYPGSAWHAPLGTPPARAAAAGGPAFEMISEWGRTPQPTHRVEVRVVEVVGFHGERLPRALARLVQERAVALGHCGFDEPAPAEELLSFFISEDGHLLAASGGSGLRGMCFGDAMRGWQLDPTYAYTMVRARVEIH